MTRQTWRFFALTFAISWLLWMPSVLRSNGILDLPEIVGLLAMFAPLGPSIAAFVLVAVAEGRAGVQRLARRGIAFDFNKWWLLPILLLMPAISVLQTIVLSLVGDLPDGSAPSLVAVVGTFFFILIAGGGLEEFGWRGYALDRLQRGYNALVASLVLGFFWGLWHLPLHFISTSTQAHIPIWQFVLNIMVLAILFTWLHNNTGGSVLVAILFHTISNTSTALFPPYFATETGRWVSFGILLLVVVLVIAGWGWRTLRRG